MLKTPRLVGLTWSMIGVLVGIHLLGTVFEGVGLTMLLPVFHLLESGKTPAQLAATSPWWGYLVHFYDLFGLTVTIPILSGEQLPRDLRPAGIDLLSAWFMRRMCVLLPSAACAIARSGRSCTHSSVMASMKAWAGW